MTSQHNDPSDRIEISPAAAAMLAVSVLSSTALAGLVVAQAVAPIHVYLGGPVLLGAVATLFGGGFLADIAVAKVMRRLDRIDERVSAQRVAYLPAPAALDDDALRERVERMAVEELGTREAVRAAGYAEGYVDGIDRRDDGTAAN